VLGESLRRHRPRERSGGARTGRARGGRPSRRFWVMSLALALLVPFAIGYLLTVFVIFPPRPVAPAGIPVPALYGKTLVEAERLLARAGLGRLQVTMLPNPTSPEGDITAQSPLPGQQLRSGADVRVAVSSGPVQVRVPDLLGQPAERALERLQQLGFTVARVDSQSAVDSGRVFAVDPVAGTMVRLPALATLHVSLGAPPDSLGLDSLVVLPPDTLAKNR
jgi:beta-lactam-binding protein with PASTA domain